MVPVEALWRPILLSAFFIFVLSNILWMALPFWHAKDYKKLTNEADALKALEGAEGGQYVLPCVDWKTATKEQKAACQQGPSAFLILRPAGGFSFPGALVKYALYCVFMVGVCAYLCGLVLPAGAPYTHVFRVMGTAGILAFAFSDILSAIWYGKPGAVAAKTLVDGILNGLLMAGTFGWLWPK
jgi:hypothetical protein